MTDIATPRRTKRRYAHELYPHPGEDEVRPLDVDVPHLYAIALGLEVWGTGWFAGAKTDEHRREALDRTLQLVEARRLAFIADALNQDMVGNEAWQWAEEHSHDETGELVWERATHYGVRPQSIKPYPCGPTPDRHDHYADQDDRSGIVTHIDGPEDTCLICTEEIPEDDAP